MAVQLYYGHILHQLLGVLSADEEVPPAHQRAAAFSLSRMMSEDKIHGFATRIVLSALHRPLLEVTVLPLRDQDTSSRLTSGITLTPSETIRTLQALLTNTDPSPTLVSSLLTPVIAPLYGLLYALDSVKTSDPAQKTTVRGILRTWGRLADTVEGMAILWSIVDGEGGEWRVSILGDISRVEQ